MKLTQGISPREFIGGSHIFLSYIFLFGFCKQEDVGQEDINQELRVPVFNYCFAVAPTCAPVVWLKRATSLSNTVFSLASASSSRCLRMM